MLSLMVHLALEDGYQKLERGGGETHARSGVSGHVRLARRDGDELVPRARSLRNKLESVEILV